jgi:hypothetical protein
MDHRVAICANHGEVFKGCELTFLRPGTQGLFMMDLRVPLTQMAIAFFKIKFAFGNFTNQASFI